MRHRRLPVWAIVSAAWLGPAILAAFEAYVEGRLGHREPATPRALVWAGGDWLICALLTPAVFWMARRYPLMRGTVARHLPIHLGAALLFCVAWAGMGVFLSLAMLHSGPYGGGAVSWLLTTLPFGVAVYFAVLGVAHAAAFFVEAQERKAQLAEARLGALRMQLQPHFLFNSLNAIAVTVRDRDTQTAIRLVDQLGLVLRRVMRTDRPPEVTLAEELEFVRQYLAIEEVRFSDRLRPTFDIDTGLERAAVPEFVLQPLVENALRHGLARRVAATLLKIEAHRDGLDLVLRVTDDGPGPNDPPAEVTTGVGLMNLRERLASLYGARGRLELGATPDGGAVATVRLPYHELTSARA